MKTRSTFLFGFTVFLFLLMNTLAFFQIVAVTQGAQSYDLNGYGKADIVWHNQNN